MRRPADRIRHAISFEVIALILVTPLGAWVFGFPLHDIGVLSVIGATLAMIWNYVFNLGFDHAMQRALGHTAKTPLMRVGHSVLFELGLLVVLAPVIAWYLGVTLWQAVVMDVAFAGFFLVYAFVFNWAYDVVFPVRSQPVGDRPNTSSMSN
ncbi:PACE efflux transporter [Alterinioella nitratireducens]|uniref:PACE efflux transporter n=1 Tax=Alterinioella nitratireducens TaxID=2735915 RepID=UPI004058B99A